MRIKVRFTEDKPFRVTFGTIQNITEYVGGEVYDGTYEVTPKVNAQEMQTEGKIMLHDVTIKSIPFHKVSNQSGGNTVHIGDEL